MKEETTPTTGLQMEDIKRLTCLIRALYFCQRVHNDGFSLQEINGDRIEAFHLRPIELRSISSLADDEAVQVAKIVTGCRDVSIMSKSNEFFKIQANYKVWNGQFHIYYDRTGFYVTNCHTENQLAGNQYLYQRGFALPFYDSITNTTITVEQQIEYGIIKLKS